MIVFIEGLMNFLAKGIQQNEKNFNFQ